MIGPRPWIARALGALAVVIGSTGLVASPAAAHVTIDPPAASPGSFATIAFRVPNERPDRATVKLQVKLPDDPPIRSVSLRPVPGWTSSVERVELTPPPGSEGNVVTEAVSVITWEGGRIEPDQYQDFEITLGPLPSGEAKVVLPTLQFYEGGEEVAWIQRSTGGAEVERPAPVLELRASAAGGPTALDEHGAPVSAASTPVSVGAAPSSSAVAAGTGTPVVASSDAASTTLASLGLGVALVALALAVTAVVVARRRPQPPAGEG